VEAGNIAENFETYRGVLCRLPSNDQRAASALDAQQEDEDEYARRAVAAEYARGAVLTFLCGEDDNVIIDDATMTLTCNGKGRGADEVMTDGVALLDNLDLAIEEAKSGVEKAFKDRGRRRGVSGFGTVIDMFVFQLAYAIFRMNGFVTGARTAKYSPRYIDRALDILRPCLPPEFPKDVSWAIEKAVSRASTAAPPVK
jgi:hypothetical protein